MFFDNVQVVQTRSPILEETHYYPFGLTMAGISSKAAGGIENKKQKFQGQELTNDFDLGIYEFKYRMDDCQTGRFCQIDPLAMKYVYNSTYAFSENKVTGDVELEGLEAVPTEDKRPYPQRIPQKPAPINPFSGGSQSGPPASPPQETSNTIVTKKGTKNDDFLGITATNMATASKTTHFEDPWLGTAKTIVTVGIKTGEEKTITINGNTVDRKTEGGDISAAGITVGASIEGGNPSVGVNTGNGNEIHTTLPLSFMGLLIKGISIGSSSTDGNNVKTNTEHSYKPGQNTIITVGAAAIIYFNPYLIPFVPALKSAIQ